MNNLEEIRAHWISVRATYQRFGEEIAKRLRHELRCAGIWADVTSRAKEVDSLIRKLIVKPHHTYDSLGDKVGVRIVIRYKAELDDVLNITRKQFDCSAADDKGCSLKFDQVGYLSTHVDVRLRGGDALCTEFGNTTFAAELQIRTLAQHLWSEMSHDTFYKNDDLLSPLSAALKRRIFLLAGVVEVADNEFDRLNRDLPSNPEIVLLKALEKNYFRFTAKRGDPEASLCVIKLLAPLYGRDTGEIAAHIDDFCTQRTDVIHHVYDHAEEASERSAFLFQPEALMIYDLLETDQITLREAWATQYPERELERIATAFGISID